MKWLDEMAAIPSASLGRRLGYAVLLAVGVLMTAVGSMFWGVIGPIPLKFFPDIRPVILLGSGLFLGLYAAGGGAARRKFALWGVIGYVIGFHLEEATVHWIGPFPGSITGTRVGFVGTLGSLAALAAVLLLHVEVEHVKLQHDLASRGAEPTSAAEASVALAGQGRARILGVAAGVAGMGVVVRMGEAILGNSASGGVYILFVGAALLLGLAFVLLRFVPKRA
ncbi:MAG TPA: hypothetical protein VM370_07025 [Candidatus Thermoplasmatota archaeon]|nr:hypothetical protein [Candidatus Thermoplasmatota archaeon]